MHKFKNKNEEHDPEVCADTIKLLEEECESLREDNDSMSELLHEIKNLVN